MRHALSAAERRSTEILQLPADVAVAFKAEARARRKTPVHLLSEIIEDLADARAADKSSKASAGKTRITLAQLKKECGL